MTESGGNGGLTIRLSKWQAGILSTVLAAAMIGAFLNILSFRDWQIETNGWKVQVEKQMEQMQKETSVPRTELELREKIIYAEIEQVRQRIMSIEREARQ